MITAPKDYNYRGEDSWPQSLVWTCLTYINKHSVWLRFQFHLRSHIVKINANFGLRWRLIILDKFPELIFTINGYLYPWCHGLVVTWWIRCSTYLYPSLVSFLALFFSIRVTYIPFCQLVELCHLGSLGTPIYLTLDHNDCNVYKKLGSHYVCHWFTMLYLTWKLLGIFCCVDEHC